MVNWWESLLRRISRWKMARPATRKSAASSRLFPTLARIWRSSLAVHRPHSALGIPLPSSGPLRSHFLDLVQIRAAELHLQGSDILLQVAPLLGPGDRNDVLPLRQQPGEGQLCRSALLAPRNLLHSGDQVEIPLKVFSLKAGSIPAIVVLRQVVEVPEPSSQKSATQGRIGDEPNAEFPAHR